MAGETYTVTRSATMAAPPRRVYEQIVDFRRWTAWSPWEDLDPKMRRNYEGPPRGVGSRYRWSGNRKAGQGEMTIVEAAEPGLLRIELSFEKPFRARNDTRFDIEAAGPGSRVTWTLTGPRTLMTRVMGLFTSMDKMIGPDFEKGLTRLQSTVEGQSQG